MRNNQGAFCSDENECRSYIRRDAITDEGLNHFLEAYPGEEITKRDLFYYVYGILHSEEYRTRYANNLRKELPRIPRVATAEDFWNFSHSGKTLGDMHINFDSGDMYPAELRFKCPEMAAYNPEKFYRVEKMKFAGKRPEQDKAIIIYNEYIAVSGIPLEAYDYILNGKTAIGWVMDGQRVKTDKASGIRNDPNDWAIEEERNPRYPLDLLLRVINISLETTRIVKSLPPLRLFHADSPNLSKEGANV
ncbi:type ISP restriction/modification enzyme [Acetobacter sp.]|uniref:type ISP restriction/modification enzyme n=1 Tax=Acetobacter sp. TaxID=440 RepID=UPI0039EC61ED